MNIAEESVPEQWRAQKLLSFPPPFLASSLAIKIKSETLFVAAGDPPPGPGSVLYNPRVASLNDG